MVTHKVAPGEPHLRQRGLESVTRERRCKGAGTCKMCAPRGASWERLRGQHVRRARATRRVPCTKVRSGRPGDRRRWSGVGVVWRWVSERQARQGRLRRTVTRGYVVGAACKELHPRADRGARIAGTRSVRWTSSLGAANAPEAGWRRGASFGGSGSTNARDTRVHDGYHRPSSSDSSSRWRG